MTVYKAGFPAGAQIFHLAQYRDLRDRAFHRELPHAVGHHHDDRPAALRQSGPRTGRANDPASQERVSWLINPKGRGTSHLNCHGESERSQGRPKHFRTSERPRNFARAKLVETPNVTAGTLNPHLPKRAIAPTLMLEWLDEPDAPDLP